MRAPSPTRTRRTTACLIGSWRSSKMSMTTWRWASPGALGAIYATPRTLANTLTLNTRNMTCEHQGHAHGREDLTSCTVLASSPHARACTPACACRDACRRERRECGSSVELACSWRRGESNFNPFKRRAVPLLLLLRLHRQRRAPSCVRRSDTTVITTTIITVWRSQVRSRRGRTAFAAALRLSWQIPARTPGVSQAALGKSDGCASTPSTSTAAARSRDNSSWKKGAWIRTSATTNARSTASAVVELRKGGFLKSLSGRGKEKEKAIAISSGLTPPSPTSPSSTASPRMTNVFSLVKRFTFGPSPTESSLPAPSPFLPPELSIGRASSCALRAGRTRAAAE
ncbi:hypothetical protein DFH11DRAFT_316967 [Phellopilus nigrolimitatus]|nr:hypothetical protein DFH11DRAFT_316967 [Phellopilus nigrolimitatus]